MIRNFDERQLEHAEERLQAGLEADVRPSEVGALDFFRVFSNLLSYSPSSEEMLDSYIRNFTGRHIPKSQPVHALNLEVVLTPQQASEGGRLPIRVPVFDVCEQCGGSGQSGFFTCDQCAGRGMTERFCQVDVLIPSNLKGEMVVPVSLKQFGIGGAYLNVRVRPGGG